MILKPLERGVRSGWGDTGWLTAWLMVATTASVSAASLVAHWRLDESPPGVQAADSSGNGFDAAVQGSPESVAGVDAGGMRMTGEPEEYLTVTGSAGWNLPDFTLSAWVKYTTLGTEAHIVGKHVPNSFNGYFLSVHQNRFCLFFESDSSRLVTPGTYDDDQWHHVAGVYDQATSTAWIYVDGVLANSTTGGRSPGNGTLLNVGGVAYGYPNFAGVLDDVQVYDGALGASEIQFLSSHPGQTIPEPGVMSVVWLVATTGLALRRRSG